MATTFASLGLGQLTDDEKWEVVGELWGELVAAAPPGSLLTDAQRDELGRRQADARSNPQDFIPLDDAVAAIRARLGP